MCEHETNTPSLAELSEAVPQCEWKASGRYIGTANHMSLIGECRDENGNWSDTKISKVKAAFVARLASDYFAGRLIDPTTLTEAVAAARAEGRVAGLEEAAQILTKRRGNNLVMFGDKSTRADECHRAFVHIRALISVKPTTPGGRTDG